MRSSRRELAGCRLQAAEAITVQALLSRGVSRFCTLARVLQGNIFTVAVGESSSLLGAASKSWKTLPVLSPSLP